MSTPNLRFIALGGQDERGKNMYLLEINDDLFLLDAGIKFPDKGILGIDVVIPNLDYLKENKHRIKGLFLTNAASANSGATNYLVRNLEIPVFANAITTQILKYKNQKMRLRSRDHLFNVIKDKQVIKFPSTKVEVFRLTASSPQTFGFAFSTPLGKIVYAGDYIIDGTEHAAFSTDFNHLSHIANQGVLVLISDASYASRQGFTASHHKITPYIMIPFKEKNTKIAIGIFEEDIFKLGEIIKTAKENHRKIAIYDKSLLNVLENNDWLKNLDVANEDFFSVQDYMDSENGVLIISGNAEALYQKLNKIANNNDDIVSFSPNTLIILATPPSPGVEKRHAHILDELARTDARVTALSDRNIWSMNASYEDIKVMTSLMKPKYFVPIKGLFKDFLVAKKAAEHAGVKKNNAQLLDNGQIVSFNRDYISIANQLVKNGDVYVDGLGIGDIGNVVLNERKQLASDGVIIVGLSIDARNKELISSVDIQMRGVFYIKEDSNIFKILQKQIFDIITKYQDVFRYQPNAYDLNDVKHEIISKVRSSIKQESGKQPMILAIVNEISDKEFIPHIRNTKNIKGTSVIRNQNRKINPKIIKSSGE